MAPKTKFKSLGIFFSTTDDCVNDNIHPRLKKIRNVMNMWKERDLSIKGRITLIKSLMASQLTYIATVVKIPPDTMKSIDREIKSFMWRGRPPKVKWSVMCQPIERGGLGAVNIDSYIKSIRLSWLRRMLTDTDAKWRMILQQAIGHIALPDLLRGNLTYKFAERLRLPSFYCNIILEYHRMKPVPRPNCAEDIQCQCLWYNVNIQIDSDTVFFSGMYRQGIKYIGHIVRNGELIDFNSLCRLYPGTSVNSFHYQCLKHAIPREWKTTIRANKSVRFSVPIADKKLSIRAVDSDIDIATAQSKHFYLAVIPSDVTPTCKVRWSGEHFNFEEERWKEIYRLPYEVSTSTKLQTLQYRIINRYVPTRKFLFDRKIIQSPQCYYCKEIDNLYHFLYDCLDTRRFWNDVMRVMNRNLGRQFRLSAELVLFGCKKLGVIANLLILLAKQYIVNKKLKCETLLTNVFWIHVRRQYEVEKCIVSKPGSRVNEFNRRWQKFVDFLDTQ